jgi:hypothetical protein
MHCGRDVSDNLKAARNAFKTAKGVLQFLGTIAFLLFLLLGYIATGGKGFGGFLRFLGLG